MTLNSRCQPRQRTRWLLHRPGRSLCGGDNPAAKHRAQPRTYLRRRGLLVSRSGGRVVRLIRCPLPRRPPRHLALQRGEPVWGRHTMDGGSWRRLSRPWPWARGLRSLHLASSCSLSRMNSPGWRAEGRVGVLGLTTPQRDRSAVGGPGHRSLRDPPNHPDRNPAHSRVLRAAGYRQKPLGVVHVSRDQRGRAPNDLLHPVPGADRALVREATRHGGGDPGSGTLAGSRGDGAHHGSRDSSGGVGWGVHLRRCRRAGSARPVGPIRDSRPPAVRCRGGARGAGPCRRPQPPPAWRRVSLWAKRCVPQRSGS